MMAARSMPQVTVTGDTWVTLREACQCIWLCKDLGHHNSSARMVASPGMMEEDDDQIEISKELFLTVVQDSLRCLM